ncbi:Hypothetical protein AJF4211_000100 [Avibacterium paragallinarum JF4211]|nr:Hypothetical protein AJF4211_000100 [Avibacterium paragallinarum JF4211]
MVTVETENASAKSSTRAEEFLLTIATISIRLSIALFIFFPLTGFILYQL